MSELSLPNLKIEITADATNALEAIQRLLDVLSSLQAACINVEQIISSTKTHETGVNVVAGLAEGLSETSAATSAAQSLAQAVIDAIGQAFSGVDGASLGEELLGGVAEGASGGGSGIAAALVSAVTSAVASAAASALNSGRSIGVNLMSGIQAGIQSRVSAIVSAARNAVIQAIAAAKAAANIHSPSRAMRDQVGVMLMRGVEEGISERLPSTLQVIRESMSGVVSGAAAVINRSNLTTPAFAAPTGTIGIDYERMGETIGDAMRTRPIQFSVGARQLTTVTRDEAARQQAIRVSQINAGYGGKS